MDGRIDLGAVVTFTGIEHHPELAEVEIASMLGTATVRFHPGDAMVIHRLGCLPPGEPIMQVITTAPHRRAAFEGAPISSWTT